MILASLLDPKISPKGSQNDLKTWPKSCTVSVLALISFSSLFLVHFSSLSQAPHPRFNCYLQCFRGVHHFPRSLQNYQNRYPKVEQNHSQKHLKSDQKSMKKATLPERRKTIPKGCQNGARRGPIISKKNPKISPGVPKEPPGIPRIRKADPKHPQRRPKGTPGIPKGSRKAPQTTPNDPQGAPNDPQTPPKGTPGIPKKRDWFFDWFLSHFIILKWFPAILTFTNTKQYKHPPNYFKPFPNPQFTYNPLLNGWHHA